MSTVLIDKFRLLDGVLQCYTRGGTWVSLYTLTEDEVDAISGSASPSSSNVVITTSALDSYIDTKDEQNTITSLTPGSSITLDWDGSQIFDLTLTGNGEIFDSNLPANPLSKEIKLVVTPDSNTLTFPTYWNKTAGTYSTTLDNIITAICTNEAATAKVATLTLTGTAGNATVGAAGGLSKVAAFDSDLTTTAANFVTDHASAYLAEKIVVTSDGAVITFTAQYAGYDFTTPTITTITGDMGGSVANTAANGTGTAQVDTLTVSGNDGKVTVTGAGSLSKDIEFDTDLSTTAAAFVSDYAADYAAEGITVTSSTADIIFTAAEAGTAFTSPVKNQVVGDLAGSVANTQANVAAVAQVDTITLTGTSGAAIIGAAGGLTNSAVFNSDLTTTASDFVTNQAADYAAEGITVTSSGADIIFTSDTAGTSFTSPTITNDYGDLAGSVANTAANVVAVAQVDTVTVTGTDGEASMTAAGGLTKEVRFDTDLTTTAANFVTDHAAAYSGQDITITSSGAELNPCPTVSADPVPAHPTIEKP